jgi:hypothetical protein
MIDFGEVHPAWRYLRNADGEIVHVHPRVHGAAILLPDGKVMAVGGNREARWDKPIHEVDVFDPETDTWESDHAPIKVERGYHATAMLLPDARILVSGTTPPSHREERMEVYAPYYLDGDPVRPEIVDIRSGKRAPDDESPQLTYGASFHVDYNNLTAEPVKAALVRPGAMTHAFDMDQRHVWLKVIIEDDETLQCIAPPDPHVAPPGYYMLFLLDGNGTPSKAAFVHLPVIPIG